MQNTFLLDLDLNFASPVPVYDQICSGIKLAIAQNTLKEGDCLPSIREMASYLRVNPNTVARAYRELSTEGIINGRAGKGYWVKKTSTPDEEKLALLEEDFKKFIKRGIEMGFSSQNLKDIVNQYFDKGEAP